MVAEPATVGGTSGRGVDDFNDEAKSSLFNASDVRRTVFSMRSTKVVYGDKILANNK